jgi:hypothetical protein
VALPLTGFGYSKWMAFLYGQISGMVRKNKEILNTALKIFQKACYKYSTEREKCLVLATSCDIARDMQNSAL